MLVGQGMGAENGASTAKPGPGGRNEFPGGGQSAGSEPGERWFVKFDFAAIDALQENEDTKSQVQERLVRSGIMTINEVRRLENMPPVPWGDAWPTGTDG